VRWYRTAVSALALIEPERRDAPAPLFVIRRKGLSLSSILELCRAALDRAAEALGLDIALFKSSLNDEIYRQHS